MAVNRTMTFRRRLIPIACLAAMSLAGCVQQSAEPPGRVVRTADGAGRAGTPLPTGDTPPNALDAIDPVGARLQDAGGLLILYYGLYKKMPATLEEVKPLAQSFQSAEFVEPQTGKPFVYLPYARRMSAGDSGVVAYAPTPDADGYYKALRLLLARPGQTPTSGVVTLSPAELQAVVGATPPAQPPVVTPPATQPQ